MTNVSAELVQCFLIGALLRCFNNSFALYIGAFDDNEEYFKITKWLIN